MKDVYNGVYYAVPLLEHYPIGQDILSRCDMSQKSEDIYRFLKTESDKAGIKCEIDIIRSPIMQQIRSSMVIYGLLALNYGDIEKGIDIIEKVKHREMLPLKVDEENQEIIIRDGKEYRKYKFDEVIFVEDFFP